MGVINVESTAPGQLTTNDIDLLLILANQLAIAITNAGLFDTVARQVQQLELLARSACTWQATWYQASAGHHCGGRDDPAATGQHSHLSVRPGAGSLYLWPCPVAGWPPHPGDDDPAAAGLSYQVVRGAAPVVLDHADHHPLYADWADRTTVPQSIAGVPLMRAGRVLGVFTTAF